MIITFHAQTPFVPIKETTKVDKVDPSWKGRKCCSNYSSCSKAMGRDNMHFYWQNVAVLSQEKERTYLVGSWDLHNVHFFFQEGLTF
jgi:hypothetical protein